MKNEQDLSSILEKYNFWNSKPLEYGHLRSSYLQKIESLLDNSLVKVILGQRRSGKSRLMRMLIHHLMTHKKVVAENIFYINRELHVFNFIKDDKALVDVFQYYRDLKKPQGKIYFLIDEVQEIACWEMAVNSLSQDYRLDIELFITGSNAHLLSGELATYLAGRYVSLTVYPFSYQEYCDIFSLSKDKKSVLSYLENGGLPEIYQFNTMEGKDNYIKSLMDSIVLRDIVQRHKIRDVFLLEKVIQFTINSVGSMLSVPSIVKTLAHHGYRSNVETIGNYLNFCKETFFLHECERYDLRGKQILIGERKYYLNDVAFKIFNQSAFDSHISRTLENIVYLSLLRQGYKVYVGRYGDKEVDFVAEKAGEKLYIQVAYLLADESVIEREFGALALIPDNYPKWVISLDDVLHGNKQGIIHKQLWDSLV